jgi:hypothetical protein
MGADKQSCENCAFYLARGPAAGICRRFPPTLAQTDWQEGTRPIDARFRGVFPEVPLEQWCGEWKADAAVK